MTEEATDDRIAELRALADEMIAANRAPEPVPPWRTPEGKADKARRVRNKQQRQARKRARRS